MQNSFFGKIPCSMKLSGQLLSKLPRIILCTLFSFCSLGFAYSNNFQEADFSVIEANERSESIVLEIFTTRNGQERHVISGKITDSSFRKSTQLRCYS